MVLFCLCGVFVRTWEREGSYRAGIVESLFVWLDVPFIRSVARQKPPSSLLSSLVRRRPGTEEGRRNEGWKEEGKESRKYHGVREGKPAGRERRLEGEQGIEIASVEEEEGKSGRRRQKCHHQATITTDWMEEEEARG